MVLGQRAAANLLIVIILLGTPLASLCDKSYYTSRKYIEATSDSAPVTATRALLERSILQVSQSECIDGPPWVTCVHDGCGTNIAEEIYARVKPLSCVYTGPGRMWDCGELTMDDPTYNAIFQGSCEKFCKPSELQCQFTARFATPDRIYFDTEFCLDGSVVSEYKCGCQIMGAMQKAEYMQLMQGTSNGCEKVCSIADRDLTDCKESLEIEEEKDSSKSDCQEMLCLYKGCAARIPKIGVDIIKSSDCEFSDMNNMWSCNSGEVQIDDPSFNAAKSGTCITGCDAALEEISCLFEARYDNMPEVEDDEEKKKEKLKKKEEKKDKEKKLKDEEKKKKKVKDEEKQKKKEEKERDDKIKKKKEIKDLKEKKKKEIVKEKGKPKEKDFEEFLKKPRSLIYDKKNETSFVKKKKLDEDADKKEDKSKMKEIKYIQKKKIIEDKAEFVTKEAKLDEKEELLPSKAKEVLDKYYVNVTEVLVNNDYIKDSVGESELDKVISPYLEIYKSPWMPCKQMCNIEDGTANIKERYVICRHQTTGLPLSFKLCGSDISLISSLTQCQNDENVGICNGAFIPIFKEWSSCPSNCSEINNLSTTSSYRNFSCHANTDSFPETPETNCNTLNLDSYLQRPCNSVSCVLYTYVINQWGPCSCPERSKSREVFCADIKNLDTPVANSLCKALGLEKPYDTTSCKCTDNYLNRKLLQKDISKDTDNGDCISQVFNSKGECCGNAETNLDRNGECCNGPIDACGVCNGNGKFVDGIGRCCEGSLDAAGLCCPTGNIDECGVCDGYGNSCNVNISFFVNLKIEDIKAKECILNTTSDALLLSVNEESLFSLYLDESPDSYILSFAGFLSSYYTSSNAIYASIIQSFNDTDKNACTELLKSIISIDVERAPVCGNGVCEIGEADGIAEFSSDISFDLGNKCPDDCLLNFTPCPVATNYEGVGSKNLPCSGRGLCYFGQKGTCECYKGYSGSACERCASDYYSLNGTCLYTRNSTENIFSLRAGDSIYEESLNNPRRNERILVALFISSFAVLTVMSFFIVVMAMNRKKSASSGYTISASLPKDTGAGPASLAKTYSNIWDTFQKALVRGSGDIDSSTATDIFSKHPDLLCTHTENGAETEVTPKTTPSPVVEDYFSTSSPEQHSADLDKCKKGDSAQRGNLRSAKSEELPSKSIPRNLLEESCCHVPSRATINSLLSIRRVHSGANGFDISDNAVFEHPDQGNSHLEHGIPLKFPDSILKLSPSAELYPLEPILETEKSSSRSLSSVSQDLSEASYDIHPVHPVSVQEPSRDPSPSRATGSSPLSKKDLLLSASQGSGSGNERGMSPVKNNSSGRSSRGSIASIISSLSGRSRANSKDKNIDDKHLSSYGDMSCHSHSHYGNLTMEEQHIVDESDAQDIGHHIAKHRISKSEFEFDKPDLVSTLTKDAVYHRRGFSGNLVMRESEDDMNLYKPNKTGRRCKSRGFDYIMKVAESEEEEEDIEMHYGVKERPLSAPLYQATQRTIHQFAFRDQLVNAKTLEDVPNNIIRKPVKLTSKRCNLSLQLLADPKREIVSDTEDVDDEASRPYSGGEEERPCSSLSDTCIESTMSSSFSSSSSSRRRMIISYPSGKIKMNSSTEPLPEMKARRPVKAITPRQHLEFCDEDQQN